MIFKSILVISMFSGFFGITDIPKNDNTDRHAQSSIRYTQAGKDCIVSSNGSARVAHNTKCPKE